MLYKDLVFAYQKIEATTKRLAMTDFLVDLIKRTPKDILGKMVYLTQGKLYPDYEGIEIGMAEKLVIRALARAANISGNKINNDLRKTGDLGESAQKFLPKPKKPLTIEKVWVTLDKIAKTGGEGSVEKKVNLLAEILSHSGGEESKYIIRTVTSRLRLGIADMTMIDALSIVYGGGKANRGQIEKAYNNTSDLGTVAETLSFKGLKAISRLGIIIGKPLRPMLTERLGDPKEILEKLGGKCAAEYKYDGERVQAHKNGERVLLFSRRLENITDQYPDIVSLIKKYISAKRAIIDAETVAINPETGEMRPFQDLMHRRRKHGIGKAMEDYPIALFVFDLLYSDGKDLTHKPYNFRREELKKVLKETDIIKLAQTQIISNVPELDKLFEIAIEQGLEGLVCKSVQSDSVYQAGSRGWLWIKYKRDYKSEMIEPADLVIVGGFYGRGRRKATYGALLLASYDDKTDMFRTITKCGSGFTDKDLAEIPKKLKPYAVKHKHPRVDSKLVPDQWFTPGLVIEVIGAEITLSPIHTTAWDKIRKDSGLAIRFPRFTGHWREEKSPEDATTVSELVEMYQAQLKKIKK